MSTEMNDLTTPTPEDPADPEPYFISQLGFGIEPSEGGMVGEIRLVPELMVPEHPVPRVSVLATAGDILIGQLANALTSEIALTVDLAVRVLRPVEAERLTMSATILKAGRTLIAGEAYWVDHRGDTVAHCWATFMASPRPLDSGLTGDPEHTSSEHRGPTLKVPFPEMLKLEVPRPGIAEVARRPAVLQPTGTLQGGVVCALAELAAESTIGAPVTSLDTRYLAGIREGNGRATATELGPGVAQVIVTDTLRPERPAAVVHAGTTRVAR
jgi:acyl-coenzyme A thioesterase PaaI-like protein